MTATHQDFTEEAVELFTRFVKRHGFQYEVETTAPVEVLWTVPAQQGLSLPLTLCLSNSDELSLGVEEFWPWMFPYDRVAPQFEEILEKWVAGDARVGVTGKRGRILQVQNGNEWKTVYRANTMPFFTPKPKAFIYNDPSYSNSTMT